MHQRRLENKANRRESAYGPSSTTRRSTTEDHQGGMQTVRCEGISRDDDSRARHRGGGKNRPEQSIVGEKGRRQHGPRRGKKERANRRDARDDRKRNGMNTRHESANRSV